MSSSWQRLDDLWYRRIDISGNVKHSQVLNDAFLTHVVSAAKCGGPIAMVRDERVFQQLRPGETLIPKLHICTAYGRQLGSVDWTFRGLMGLHWAELRDSNILTTGPATDSASGNDAITSGGSHGSSTGVSSYAQVLCAVFSDGMVRVFDVFCNLLKTFSIDDRCQREGVIACAFWPHGIAILTGTNKVLVNFAFDRRNCMKFHDIEAPKEVEKATSTSFLSKADASTPVSPGISICVLPRSVPGQNIQPKDPNISEITVGDTGFGCPLSELAINGPIPSMVTSGNRHDIRVLISTHSHGTFVVSRHKCELDRVLNDTNVAPSGSNYSDANSVMAREFGRPDPSYRQDSSNRNQNGPDGQSKGAPDPIVSFCVSPTGFFLATLSQKGIFKVFDNDLLELDKAQIECRRKPKQMLWVGEDCIALYLTNETAGTTSNGSSGAGARINHTHALFVGGVRNDWIPYTYDMPLHIVGEVDGIRVISATKSGLIKSEFVQRVPTCVESIYAIGSCEPPAMLCYALERFVQGDVRSEESLRAIKQELPDAVCSVIEAATCEFEEKNVTSLLQAAVFGRTFLSALGEASSKAVQDECCRRFVVASTYIRISIALRRNHEIPITIGQIQSLGLKAVIELLLQRREHLLAKRISEWLGLPTLQVLTSWARDKIFNSPALTDAKLCELIVKKLTYEETDNRGRNLESPSKADRVNPGFGGAGGTSRSNSPIKRGGIKATNVYGLEPGCEMFLGEGPTSQNKQVAKILYFGRQPQKSREEMVLAQMHYRGASPFVGVAEFAANGHRPGLATMLLKYELQPIHCIKMLLQLQEYSLAFEQATVSRGDPELVRECLNESASLEFLLDNPRARNLHIHTLQRLGKNRELLSFAEGWGQKQLVATTLAAAAYGSKSNIPGHNDGDDSHHGIQAGPLSITEQIDLLAKASTSYALKSELATGGEKKTKETAEAKVDFPPNPFAAAITQEQVNLLKEQEKLEQRALENNWGTLPNLPPHYVSANSIQNVHYLSTNFPTSAASSTATSTVSYPPASANDPRNYLFIGRSLLETVRALVMLGEIQEADRLRKDFHIPEKRYWQSKVRALFEARNVDELTMLGKNRTSPIGYVPFVEGFIKIKRIDLAKEFVKMIAEPEQQSSLLLKMGLPDEAAQALQKKSEGLLGNWFGTKS